MKKIFLLFLAISIFSCGMYAENSVPPSLDSFVMERITKASKPGAAIAVVREGKIVFVKGYGYAHLGKKVEMTEDTPVTIGSLSKVFTAFAVMQLKEAGKLDLDEDVNNYLPFKVRNPYYPDTPITLTMLLTHTSGISDNWFQALWWVMGQGDPKIRLGEFVKGYLTKGEKYFHRNNFDRTEPGTKFGYSNIGVCLAACIVENVSGMEFEEYCRKNIFEPLAMHNTSFYFRNLKLQTAMPYEKIGGLFYKQMGNYSAPFYPAGFLKTSANDLGKFLAMLENKGKYGSIKLMCEETVQEMLTPWEGVIPDHWDRQCLMFQNKRIEGRNYIGHTGGLWGIASVMFYDPEREIGALILTNGGWVSFSEHDRMKEKPIREIFLRLMTEAERM